MPRGGFTGIPHPELIRNVDGHDIYGGRNVATPFGDNPEDDPNEELLEDGTTDY